MGVLKSLLNRKSADTVTSKKERLSLKELEILNRIAKDFESNYLDWKYEWAMYLPSYTKKGIMIHGRRYGETTLWHVYGISTWQTFSDRINKAITDHDEHQRQSDLDTMLNKVRCL